MAITSKYWIPLACLLFSPSLHAQVFKGVFHIVSGDVRVQSAVNGEIGKAFPGSKVFPEDTIITGKNSRAKILMVDRNVLAVLPDSRVKLQKYEFNARTGKMAVELSLDFGKVRSQVVQKYDGKHNKFLIKTPTTVAGVRGTDFVIGFNGETTDLVTIEGSVEFGKLNADGGIVEPVVVSRGMSAVDNPNQSISAPVSMAEDQLRSLQQETLLEPLRPREFSESLNVTNADADPVSTEASASFFQFTIGWFHFDLGVSRLGVSSSHTTGPFLGYTPQLNWSLLPDWLEISPRLDLQFNKNPDGKTDSVQSFGARARFRLSETMGLSLEVAQASMTEGAETRSFSGTGFFLDGKLSLAETGILSSVETVFAGYRAWKSPIASNQLIVGLGIGF